MMVTKQVQITANSAAETRQLGQTLGTAVEQPLVMALTGDLGSGKTVFVQGLARGLDISEKYYITSPTFTLINEYPGRYRLYHVDLYRIEHATELDDVGLEEVLQANAVIAIEWADKLPQDALRNHMRLRFEIWDRGSRRIDIFAYGHPAANLLKALEPQLQDMIK